MQFCLPPTSSPSNFDFAGCETVQKLKTNMSVSEPTMAETALAADVPASSTAATQKHGLRVNGSGSPSVVVLFRG